MSLLNEMLLISYTPIVNTGANWLPIAPKGQFKLLNNKGKGPGTGLHRGRDWGTGLGMDRERGKGWNGTWERNGVGPGNGKGGFGGGLVLGGPGNGKGGEEDLCKRIEEMSLSGEWLL